MAEPNASKASGHPTVLRLLSGSQQGAEIRLSDGTPYLIGRDDECDIVLQAESVAPKHLTLTIHQGQMHLEAQDQAVITADRTWSPGQAGDIPTGVVIRLGEICIGVGPENADWNQAVWPDAPKAPDQAIAQDTPSTTETAEPPPPAPSPTPDTPPLPPAKPRSSSKRWRWITLGGIAVLVTLALAAWWWTPVHDWLNGRATLDRAAAEALIVTKTQAIITELGMRDIDVAARPDGSIVLTGYCETRASKNRLTAALRAQGIPADNQLWPEETVRETIAYTLDRLSGKTLHYDYQGKGVLHLRGRLRPGLRYDQLQSTLHNDVPGLSRIDSEAKTLEDFAADLRKQVREAGLEKAITITAAGTSITATGTVGTEDMPRWEAISRSFAAETQDFLTFDAQVNPLEGPARPLPDPTPVAAAPQKTEKKSYGPLRIAVRGIVIGPDQVPYALLDDGTRLAEGDRIDGHYVVERILFNRMIVRDGAQRKIYYVGEPAHD